MPSFLRENNYINSLGESQLRKFILIITLSIAMMLPVQASYHAESLPEPPEKSREELFQDLFLTLLLPDIDEGINEYYLKILTESPTVYPYMVKVISVKRVYGYRSFRFLVTLEVTPVIGPHISVGKDRLTFDIGSGKTKLINFEHLETDELPENWKHIVKY